MSIGWDPKVKGANPAAPTTPGADHAPPSTPKGATASPPAAMEKPETLAAPEAAQVHPSRLAADGKPTRLDQQIATLRAQLSGPKSGRVDAAQEALALVATYAMRRSRGARRRGLEMLEAIEEHVDDLAGLAAQLRAVLTAEGDIHELEADATLRACRDLIDSIQGEGEPA